MREKHEKQMDVGTDSFHNSFHLRMKAYKELQAKAEACKKVYESRCPVFQFSTREEVMSELHKEMKPLRLFCG